MESGQAKKREIRKCVCHRCERPAEILMVLDDGYLICLSCEHDQLLHDRARL